MYQTDMYEGMIAETVTMQGANGDTINAYYARPLGPGPFQALWPSTTCPVGMSGIERQRASWPIMAMPRSRPTSTFAPAMAHPRMWPRRCAPGRCTRWPGGGRH